MDTDPTEGMNLIRTKMTHLGALILYMSDETLVSVEKTMQGKVEIYADDQFERFLNNGKLDPGVLIVNGDNEIPERARERERPPMKAPLPDLAPASDEKPHYEHVHIERSGIAFWRYEDVETQPQENDILVCLKADGKCGDRDGDRVLCSGVGRPANLREPAAIWEAPVGHAGEVVFLNTDGKGWRILKRVPEEGLEPVGTIPVVGDEACCMPTEKPDESDGAYSYHTPTIVRSVNRKKQMIEMDSQIEDGDEELDATLIAYFMTGKFRVLKRVELEPVKTRPLKGDTMRSVDSDSADFGKEYVALADGKPWPSGSRILWDTQYSENGNGLLTRPDGSGWRIVKRVEFEPIGTMPVEGDQVCMDPCNSGTYSKDDPTTVLKIEMGDTPVRSHVQFKSHYPFSETGVDSTSLAAFNAGNWRILKRKALNDRLEPLGTTPIEGDDIVAPKPDGSLSPICTIKTVLKDGWSIGTDGGRYDITYFADGDVLRILKRKESPGPAISEKFEPLGTKAVVGDLVTFARDGVPGNFIRKVKEITETEVISSTGDGVDVGYDLRGFTEEGVPHQLEGTRFRIFKRPEPDFSAPFDPEKGTAQEQDFKGVDLEQPGKVFVRGWQYESRQGPIRRMKTQGGQCYFSEAGSKRWRRESDVATHGREIGHQIPIIVANIWLRELMGQDEVLDVEDNPVELDKPKAWSLHGDYHRRVEMAGKCFTYFEPEAKWKIATETMQEVWVNERTRRQPVTGEKLVAWCREIQEQGLLDNPEPEKEEKDITGWRSFGGIVKLLEMADGRCFAWGTNAQRWYPEAKKARDFQSVEKTSYAVADMWYSAIEAQGLLNKPKELPEAWCRDYDQGIIQRLRLPDGRCFIWVTSKPEWRLELQARHVGMIEAHDYQKVGPITKGSWYKEIEAQGLLDKPKQELVERGLETGRRSCAAKPKEKFIKGWISSGAVVRRLEMPDGRCFMHHVESIWRAEDRREHAVRIDRYEYQDASVPQIRGWLDQLLKQELITKHDILGGGA